MEIRLLDVAQQELDEAIEYYNERSPGLGDHFLLEALAAFERIKKFQKRGTLTPRILAGVRRIGFPTA